MGLCTTRNSATITISCNSKRRKQEVLAETGLGGIWIISVGQHDVVWLWAAALGGLVAAAARRAWPVGRLLCLQKKKALGLQGIGAPTEKRGVSM